MLPWFWLFSDEFKNKQNKRKQTKTSRENRLAFFISFLEFVVDTSQSSRYIL